MTRIAVTGPHPVAGLAPGEEGDVELTDDQVRRLTASGHIQLVAPPPTDIEEHEPWES